MLVNLTPEQLIALASVTQQSRWGKVDQLITAEIEAAVERMVENRDIAVLHESRGYIKAMRAFQSAVRDAPKMLEGIGRTTPL